MGQELAPWVCCNSESTHQWQEWTQPTSGRLFNESLPNPAPLPYVGQVAQVYVWDTCRSGPHAARISCNLLDRMGGSIAMGVPPIAGWRVLWKIPLKWMIWGYPYFREPPYCTNIYIRLAVDPAFKTLYRPEKTVWLIVFQSISHMRRFPKMGVPRNHPCS